MTFARSAALVLALIIAACGGDDGPDAVEQACDRWNAFLAERSDAPDADAIAELERIEALEPGGDVQAAATALRARLESGDDISAAYRRLSDECT